MELGKETYRFLIGIDGVYRYNKENRNNVRACRGSWISDHTFALDWQAMSQPELFKFEITFSDNQVSVVWQGTVEKRIRSFKGKLMATHIET